MQYRTPFVATRAAVALAVGLLLALLAVPLFFELRTDALRSEISTRTEPAREATDGIRLAVAMEVAAIRGYLLTREPSMLRDYERAGRLEAEGYARLLPLARLLEPEVGARLDTLRALSALWSGPNARLVRGELAPAAFVARLPEQQGRYLEVLRASERLETAISHASARRRARVARLQRAQAMVMRVLTLLAAGAALLIFRMSGGLRDQTRLARVDALTGLLNRRAFHEAAAVELVRAARYRQHVTLAYVDVDGFKEVNDRQGHDAGDRLLQDLARALRSAVRKLDVAGRLGGDEFGFILVDNRAEPPELAVERVRAAVLAEMRGQGWQVTVSIGAVTVAGAPGDVEPLLREADALMYAGKRAGKDALRHRRLAASGA